MNSCAVFQGLSARTTSTVGSAVKRAMGVNWDNWYIGSLPSNLSATGRMEMDDNAIMMV